MERKKKSRKAAKKVKEKAKKGKDIIFTIGKRKRAVARCAVKRGSGVVLINSNPLENIKNEVLRLKLSEPLIMSGEVWKSYDFMVKVKGGGVSGQAEAARQAIARGLVEMFGSELKEKFMEYDRNLLVYDPRRTEPHKPPRSSQGPRRYKQRSKR
jgi:small subunit ribosomal protein S9